MIRLSRWLGIPNPKTPSRNKEGDDQKAKPAFLVHEWDEHRFTPKPQEIRHPAENVMQHLPERGFILICSTRDRGSISGI